jgi:hypothetical protein
VYAAAFIGDFDRVVGVENISSLLERGERRTGRWERFGDRFTEKIRNVVFDWIEDDFMLNGFWTAGEYWVLCYVVALLYSGLGVSVACRRCLSATMHRQCCLLALYKLLL